MLLFCIRSPSVQVLGGSRCAGRCGGLLARETLAQTDLYYIVVNVVQHSTPTGSFTNACKLLLEELFFCKASQVSKASIRMD
ncbi:hypothetical protein CY35_03G066500 [Sphagnum magellanicum]|nr:hypothetical protein CY35_03G066500 [Sphagnum magellanicum]